VALPQSSGGTPALTEASGRFCTFGAMQVYDVVLFILALAKTVTPMGVPGGSRAGRLVFARRLWPLSQADKAPPGFGVPVMRIGAQEPVATRSGKCIYRPVGTVQLFCFIRFAFGFKE